MISPKIPKILLSQTHFNKQIFYILLIVEKGMNNEPKAG